MSTRRSDQRAQICPIVADRNRARVDHPSSQLLLGRRASRLSDLVDSLCADLNSFFATARVDRGWNVDVSDWDLTAAGGNLGESHSHDTVGSPRNVDRRNVHLRRVNDSRAWRQRMVGCSTVTIRTTSHAPMWHTALAHSPFNSSDQQVANVLTLAVPRSHDRLNEREMHMSLPSSQTCSPLTCSTVSSTRTLSSFGAYLHCKSARQSVFSRACECACEWWLRKRRKQRVAAEQQWVSTARHNPSAIFAAVYH